MNTFNCLIVDDEPIAREIIVNYCTNLSHLNVAASCGSALEAKTFLQDNLIHIMFLDINLPVLDGISFLNVLKNPPQIIFTTAYRQFAVDAFDLSACDYLVKPFSFDRFIVAVDKAIEKLNGLEKRTLFNDANEDGYIFIKAEGKIFKINYDELLYAEAQGNYTKIVTCGRVITPNISFTNVEKLLPEIYFARVHRSFIINRSKIDHIEGNRLFINKTEISIGSNYRDSFLNSLGL
jgi:DNA-binding LytR/AlgR family response regulator